MKYLNLQCGKMSRSVRVPPIRPVWELCHLYVPGDAISTDDLDYENAIQMRVRTLVQSFPVGTFILNCYPRAHQVL